MGRKQGIHRSADTKEPGEVLNLAAARLDIKGDWGREKSNLYRSQARS